MQILEEIFGFFYDLFRKPSGLEMAVGRSTENTVQLLNDHAKFKRENHKLWCLEKSIALEKRRRKLYEEARQLASDPNWNQTAHSQRPARRTCYRTTQGQRRRIAAH
jgi:hypothetical protein